MNVNKQSLTPEDLRFTPPELSLEAISHALEEQYRLSGTLEPMSGERDQNHRLSTADSKRFVSKVSSLHEDTEVIDFQIKALLHIERKEPGLAVPRIVRTGNGDVAASILDADGQSHTFRVLEYLPGIPFDSFPPSPDGLHGIGAFQGRLSRALADFNHSAANHFMPWDISNGLVFNEYLLDKARDDAREAVSRVLPRLESVTFPALSGLRRQVIHNDCHSGNLLRAGAHSEDVVGAIDFGDMVEAPLIQDIAVSGAGFAIFQRNPVATVAAITKGFHSVFPLEDREIDHLVDLVITRLALMLLLFDFRIRAGDPASAELEAERPLVMATLSQLDDLDRDAVAARLRRTREGGPDQEQAR